MRALFYAGLMLLTLAMFGCSNGNSDAPAPDAAHPQGWISQHGAAALQSPNFAECTVCHGADLRGQGDIPSCYSVSFNGQSCHPGGPGAPHPLNGTFLDPANHGPAAKGLTAAFPNGMLDCQPCHAEPGGAGSNPRFNLGISSAGGQGCESCHGVNLAHPSDWAGPNDTFHYSVPAAVVQVSCTLCHGINLDGAGGVGVSCLGCHSSVTSFTLNCTFCHGYPPNGSADQAAPLGVAHRSVAAISPHNVCVVCHGAKQNASGGYFSAVPGYALFDKSTDTQGDHWNGRINMNEDTAYNEVNFGCDAAGCHGNAGHQLSDSGLPVAFGNYGSGAGAIPHPVDGTFLNPANHGPAAKGLTAAFPNGILDCQPCHASAPINTDPPRFDLGIAAAGGNGCEGCHNDRTAHPAAGGRDNWPWYNNSTYRHANAKGLTSQCTLCHGSNLQGITGISPACSACHVASPVTYPVACMSCHNTPPNGSTPAGNVRPNRSGMHGVSEHRLSCSSCHGGATYGTPEHYDTTAPATIQFNLSASDTMTFNGTNSTCTGVCHGEGHSNANWYQ